jgi:hypothetical protein
MSEAGSEENLQPRSCVSHHENLREKFRRSFQEFSSVERITPFIVGNVSNSSSHWIFFFGIMLENLNFEQLIFEVILCFHALQRRHFVKQWRNEVPPFREGLHLGSTVALGQTVSLRHCCQALNKTNQNIGRESQTLI